MCMAETARAHLQLGFQHTNRPARVNRELAQTRDQEEVHLDVHSPK